jgi:ABC-2 type transport system ATP-binding protein
MDDELIKFKEVQKVFGKRTILDSISFTVPEKKITGIIGASGEGKTTLLKLLIGLYAPTKGEILYSKRNIHDDIEHIKRTFGFATEDGSFHDRLTVFENMVHFGRLYHLTKKDILERTNELLEFVGLSGAKDTLGSDLSMGMKKRLDIAISLLHNPEVLILDEPTADLDPLLRKNMLDLIKRINKTGTTVIITTQLLGEMDKICDKIAILFGKKIIGEGTLEEIKAKYSARDMNHLFEKIFAKQENSEKKEKKSEEQHIEQHIDKEVHDPLYTQSIKDYVSEDE